MSIRPSALTPTQQCEESLSHQHLAKQSSPYHGQMAAMTFDESRTLFPCHFPNYRMSLSCFSILDDQIEPSSTRDWEQALGQGNGKRLLVKCGRKEKMREH